MGHRSIKQKILISGASGLIGKAFVAASDSENFEVVRLVRNSSGDPLEILWDFQSELPPSKVSGFDSIIHLAGEGIAEHRWNPEVKARIRNSRVVSTTALAKSIAQLAEKPKAFICASALGYYGDRGDEELSEESSLGQGFLSEVCRDWEYATKAASDAGIRVVNLRTGVVLGKNGGALQKMLPPFKFGIGGALGPGTQIMSWIHLEDFIRALCFCIESTTLSGPVNLTSPSPVTNLEFSRTLANVLHRPLGPKVPKFALKLLLGEMAEPLMLASAKVIPKKLETAGFKFKYPRLQEALEEILK